MADFDHKHKNAVERNKLNRRAVEAQLVRELA